MSFLTSNKHSFICEGITWWDEPLSIVSKGVCKTRLSHGRAMWQGHEGVPDNRAALVLRVIPPLDSETEQSRKERRWDEKRRGKCAEPGLKCCTREEKIKYEKKWEINMGRQWHSGWYNWSAEKFCVCVCVEKKKRWLIRRKNDGSIIYVMSALQLKQSYTAIPQPGHLEGNFKENDYNIMTKQTYKMLSFNQTLLLDVNISKLISE